jgi:DNA topoisomerase-1
VPKGTEPAALSIDEAVRLLAERAAKGGGKKPARKAAAPKGKAKATASDEDGDDAKPAKKAAPKAKKAPAAKSAKSKAKTAAES